MNTLTVFVRRYGQRIDWPEVRARMTGSGLEAVLDAYLDLAHRYMSLPDGLDARPTPTPTLRARRAACVLNAVRGWPGTWSATSRTPSSPTTFSIAMALGGP